MDYKYDNLINKYMEQKKLIKINNNISLKKEQLDILNKYNIPIEQIHTLKELIYYIEELAYYDYEDLDLVSKELAEQDYYINYRK